MHGQAKKQTEEWAGEQLIGWMDGHKDRHTDVQTN